jgi:sensor histidine kinase YesM
MAHRLVRPILATAVFNTAIAAILVLFLDNTFLDLLISAQVVGFTMLTMLYPALTAKLSPMPRRFVVAGALIGGAIVGTLLVVLVKGRDLQVLVSNDEYLWSVATTAILGFFFGSIAVAVQTTRARVARAEAELLRSEADRQRLARRNAEAELMVVRAQIEPHFLFNTLANLSFLIKENPPQAELLLENLIDYLQAAVPRIRGESNTLRHEITMASAYVSILQIRMGERLKSAFDVPAELLSAPFPPMMLITLVENAIKHGLNPLPEGGTVIVSVARCGDQLQVRVADDGAGLAEPAGGAGEGVGLTNIRERLQAMFGASAHLSIEPNRPRGAVATISLPLESSADA